MVNGAECCARWLVLEDVDRVPAEANLAANLAAFRMVAAASKTSYAFRTLWIAYCKPFP